MKNLVNIVTNSLPIKPTESLPKGTEVLDKVLQAWVPEIYNYPEQLKRIRNYMLRGEADSTTPAKNKLDLINLRDCLIKAPPHLTENKVNQLFILLDGIKIALDHFGLQSEQELNALLRAHKKAFIASLFCKSAHTKTDRKRTPDENKKKTL